MKRALTIFIAILLLVDLSGCGKQKDMIKAYSEIDEYYVYMSSVPGLPISIEIISDGYDGAIICCDKGDFLSWGQETDHKVIWIGDEYHFRDREVKIYWGPGAAEKDASIEISLFKDSKVIFAKTYRIKANEDRGFSFVGDEQ